jgi:hypothetical protein
MESARRYRVKNEPSLTGSKINRRAASVAPTARQHPTPAPEAGVPVTPLQVAGGPSSQFDHRTRVFVPSACRRRRTNVLKCRDCARAAKSAPPITRAHNDTPASDPTRTDRQVRARAATTGNLRLGDPCRCRQDRPGARWAGRRREPGDDAPSPAAEATGQKLHVRYAQMSGEPMGLLIALSPRRELASASRARPGPGARPLAGQQSGGTSSSAERGPGGRGPGAGPPC